MPTSCPPRCRRTETRYRRDDGLKYREPFGTSWRDVRGRTIDRNHAPASFRLLPLVDDLTRPFWTGGEHGELRIWRCQACGYWIHPPSTRCPKCLSTDVTVEAASGRAVIHTFTVNHQPWMPGLEPPYVVAIVALPEQDGLRLTTNVLDVDISEVFIGMAVDVRFEHHDDVWIPVFVPAAGAIS